MKEEKTSDFIKFGSYSATEADILRPEFEKIGIPVKVLYPGTNIGKEYTGGARWTSYTLMIPSKDINRALEVCRRLNIKARYKIPLPGLLYTNINRYIFAIIAFGYLGIIILNAVRPKNELIYGIFFVLPLIGWIAFLIVTAYKILKKKDN